MLTAHRLFGRNADPEDLLGHTPFLERARQEEEKAQGAGAGRSALAAYLMARLVDRWCSLPHMPDLHDGFRWQLESTRRFVTDLDPEAAESAHLAGIVESVAEDAERRGEPIRMSLIAYSYFLEHEGRLEEALDVVILSARTYPASIPADDFTRLALSVGRLNRLLARWDSANEAYAAAEASARGEMAMEIVLRSRLGRANVMRGQGNLPGAREAVERVIADADCPELRAVQADAYADLGAIYYREDRKLEFLEAGYESFIRTEDPVKRMRTLGDLGIGLAELGALEPARLAFDLVIDSPQASFTVRLNAQLELMALEATTGNRLAFERLRQNAEAHSAAMTPSMAVDYRYKVGDGLRRFGQTERCRSWWEDARVLAEGEGLNQWYFKLDRALVELDGASPKAPAGKPRNPQPDFEPRISRLASGLRQYAHALSA